MIQKLDKFWIGTLAGTLLPFLGFWIVYLYVSYERSLSWATFWKMFNTGDDHRAAVMTLSLIANMLAFWLFFFYWKLNHASKGLVFVTMLFGAYIVYLKV
jgi:hypothetical protein